MQSRAWLYEQRAIGVAASLLLLAKLAPCVTDVNHPPGVRWVRLGAAVVVLLIAALEFLKPWRGILAALLLWPHMLVLRELLAKASPLCLGIPAFWGGMLAAGLAAAVWLRLERSGDPGTMDLSPWLRRWRVALWLLLAGILISTAAGTWLTFARPAGWQIIPTDHRHLLDPGAFTDWMPLLSAAETLPPLLLGILLLNAAAFRRKSLPPFPREAAMGCIIAAGVVVAGLTLWQIMGGSAWSFDNSPPAGPFPNRNTTAPLLAVFGACAVAWGWTSRGWRRVVLWLLALLMLGTAIGTGSRNGTFTVAALLMLCLLSGTLAGGTLAKLRLGVAAALIAAVLGAAFFAPMPKLETIERESVRRVVETITAMRAGEWSVFSGERFGFYTAAVHVYRDHPLTGAGPGTLPMQLWDQGPYAKDITYFDADHFVDHVHSMPLQYLAESGLLAFAGWMLACLIWPVGVCLRTKSAAVWALPVATLGVANLFDAVWLSSGVPMLGIVLMVVAAMAPARPEE